MVALPALRRVALAVGVLWAAFTVSFVVLYLLPGDPVATMAGGGLDGEPLDPARARRAARPVRPRPAVARAVRHPAVGGAARRLRHVRRRAGSDVRAAIAEALPPTLQISVAGLAVRRRVRRGAGAASRPTRRSRWLRQLLLSLPSLAVSLPAFWVGLMLVQVFSFRLAAVARRSGRAGSAALVLPAITLGLPTGALVAQVLAKSLVQPPRRALRRDGAGQGRRPGARSTCGTRCATPACPALTVLGYVVGNLLAGSVVVETVFSRPAWGG